MDVNEPPRPSGPSLSPEVIAERARSFGAVASHYDRYRPGPPAEAVDWLLPEGAGTVVDVGAGTGALTSLLVERADEVVAVEPDERMRAALRAAVPRATAVEGRGEAIPLPDGSTDAVLASSSWHWVDPERGLAEAARVLRSGAVLGALWSGPDPDSPFLRQAAAALAGRADELEPGQGADALRQAVAGDVQQLATSLEIPPTAPFTGPEYRSFSWEMPLSADELIGLLGTFSWVILLEASERQQLLATARRLLADVLGVEGPVTVDLGFRCEAYRAVRRAR